MIMLEEHRCPAEKTPKISIVDGLEIPIATDQSGELFALSLGQATTGNVLLCGDIGSGKTSLLRLLVHTATAHYLPEELQIWAVDMHRTELSDLSDGNQTHCLFSETEAATTALLLAQLQEEHRRRLELFKQSRSSHFFDYCKKNSMPRILIVVDNAELFLEALNQDAQQLRIFKSILPTVNHFGISFIFSALNPEALLRGADGLLTRHCRCRLAMRTHANAIGRFLGTENTSDLLQQARNLTFGEFLSFDGASLRRLHAITA